MISERTPALDLLWGADAIGEAIGRSERQAKHMLSRGEIPGRKVNGRWVASLAKLKAYFEGSANA